MAVEVSSMVVMGNDMSVTQSKIKRYRNGEILEKKIIPTTDSEQLTGVDFAVRILEKKIAYLVDAKCSI
jgi:hypothetical protein